MGKILIFFFFVHENRKTFSMRYLQLKFCNIFLWRIVGLLIKVLPIVYVFFYFWTHIGDARIKRVCFDAQHLNSYFFFPEGIFFFVETYHFISRISHIIILLLLFPHCNFRLYTSPLGCY